MPVVAYACTRNTRLQEESSGTRERCAGMGTSLLSESTLPLVCSCCAKPAQQKRSYAASVLAGCFRIGFSIRFDKLNAHDMVHSARLDMRSVGKTELQVDVTRDGDWIEARMLWRFPNTPKTLSNQRTTTTTTTILRICLILPSIGMYVLTSQSRTPTTMRVITIVTNDI